MGRRDSCSSIFEVSSSWLRASARSLQSIGSVDLATRRGRPRINFTYWAPLQKASISFSSIGGLLFRIFSVCRIVDVTSAMSERALALYKFWSFM